MKTDDFLQVKESVATLLTENIEQVVRQDENSGLQPIFLGVLRRLVLLMQTLPTC